MINSVKSRMSSVFDLNPLVVDDSLRGWVEANDGLVLLEGHKVVLRRDYRSINQVKLLSGGWSGFEPMYTGFVGPGMLTGAVVGDRAASPPSPSILCSIRELAVGNPYGVLIILMNHPTNNINFMLAVEKAWRDNILVKLIFVTDDCSGIARAQKSRKGLAGVSLLFKIAGAMADQKRTLDEICNVCSDVCSVDIATISVNLVGRPHEIKLQSIEDVFSMNSSGCIDNSDEVGSKAIQVRDDLVDIRPSTSALHPYSSITDLAKTLLGYTVFGTLSQFSIVSDCSGPVVILINNYGFMLNLELNALVHKLCTQLRIHHIEVKRVYIGSVIGSRSVDGFSVTVMKANFDVISCLDHPVIAPGWPVNVLYTGEPMANLPTTVKGQPQLIEDPKLLGPILKPREADKFRRCIEFVCMALISCEEQVNKMDTEHSFYGSQIKMATEEITDALYNESLNINCPYAVFSKLSTILSNSLQNFSGSLYAVFFDGASQAFLRYLNETEIKASMWTEALTRGIAAIEYYFEMKRGDRNMLDVFYPVLEVMQKSPDTYAQIAEAAELGSLNTLSADVKAFALPDISAHVVALWVRAAIEGLNSITRSSQQFPAQPSNDCILVSDSDITIIK